MLSSGLDCVSSTPAELLEAIRSTDFGAAILTIEALDQIDPEELRASLLAQPPWSDCPLLILSGRGSSESASREMLEGFANLTILTRPLRSNDLVTAARSALNARARQRRSQRYIEDREAAETKVRELAGTLEARVAERTTELTKALAERGAIEEMLRESEELYRLIIDLSPQIPWSASPDGKVLSIGARIQATTGTRVTDWLGERWHKLFHPEDLSMARRTWGAGQTAQSGFLSEVRVQSWLTEYRWHRVRGAPRISPDGTIVRWYGTIEDIDDVRSAEDRYQQLQAELIHVSRTSAMGTMASTLAHELNQPLTAITNYIRGSRNLLSRLEMCDISAVDKALDNADRSAVRAGEIVRRLREMVTRGEVRRDRRDLNELAMDACSLGLLDAPGAGVNVTYDFSEQAMSVDVDGVQIQQVLINLLRNAVQALDAAERRDIVVRTRSLDGVCQILVEDSGPGVAPDVMERLFEPFNSTKAEGMGIGLSISRTIVEAHHGTIQYETSGLGGALFQISLPCAKVADAVSSPSQTPG